MDQSMSTLLDNLVKTAAFLDFAYEKFYKQYNVTRVQFLALFYIMEGESITLSGLGEKMSVSKANITTLVDRMEASGLVRREPDQKDRRTIRVVASEKGREVVATALPDRDKFSEGIFSCLNELEVEKGITVLTKIRSAIEEQMKEFI